MEWRRDRSEPGMNDMTTNEFDLNLTRDLDTEELDTFMALPGLDTQELDKFMALTTIPVETMPAFPRVSTPLRARENSATLFNASKQARQLAFLQALHVCGSVTEAARTAGISRTRYYEWLKDPKYQEMATDFNSTSLRERRQAAFLGALLTHRTLTKAAAAVVIDRGTHYYWLSSDPDYRRRYGRLAAGCRVEEGEQGATEQLTEGNDQ